MKKKEGKRTDLAKKTITTTTTTVSASNNPSIVPQQQKQLETSQKRYLQWNLYKADIVYIIIHLLFF